MRRRMGVARSFKKVSGWLGVSGGKSFSKKKMKQTEDERTLGQG